MACLVSGFVSMKVSANGQINLGTRIHFKNNCTILSAVSPGSRGKLVKVEGELARNMPVCNFCGANTNGTG